MKVYSLNIGSAEALVHDGVEYRSAINKRIVYDRVRLETNGFVGDEVVDKKHHGGPFMAVCCYGIERYGAIAKFLGVDNLEVPSFGENLTLEGILEESICIGDELHFDEVVLAVTKPREPCSTLARKLGNGQVGKYIHETKYTGFYCRVLKEGMLGSGEGIRVEKRGGSGVSVAEAMGAMFSEETDQCVIDKLVGCESLCPGWRERYLKLQQA